MHYLLFTTSQCPKCPEFKAFVSEQVQFEGEILDETAEGFMDQIRAAGVSAAPTIILFEGEKEVFRTDEIYQLQDFLKKA